jgi:hypothetical protein
LELLNNFNNNTGVFHFAQERNSNPILKEQEENNLPAPLKHLREK